jgi:hypothetical protein
MSTFTGKISMLWSTGALMLGLLWVIGCDDKVPPWLPGGECGGLISPHIMMDADTLNFLQADTAVCNGWVEVKNGCGDPVPGIRVSLSLERNFGFLDFLNMQLRDTTDETGRVYFRFSSFGQSGSNTIIAAISNIHDTWPIYVAPASWRPACAMVRVTPDHLVVSPGVEDSAHVEVTLQKMDSTHAGIPGITLSIEADGGRLRAFPPTDSAGHTDSWWYSGGLIGTVCFYTRLPSCNGDTACVRVDTVGGRKR